MFISSSLSSNGELLVGSSNGLRSSISPTTGPLWEVQNAEFMQDYPRVDLTLNQLMDTSPPAAHVMITGPLWEVQNAEFMQDYPSADLTLNQLMDTSPPAAQVMTTEPLWEVQNTEFMQDYPSADLTLNQLMATSPPVAHVMTRENGLISSISPTTGPLWDVQNAEFMQDYPSADLTLNQLMATSPSAAHVVTRKNDKSMTPPFTSPASKLELFPSNQQSLRYSTESTARDNPARSATMNGYLLEEERSIEKINSSMDGKHELPRCIQILQPAGSSLQPAEFSNGGEIMQNESSKPVSFEEFDAIGTGGELVSVDKSCIGISHQEKKDTIEIQERSEDKISLEDLQQHFDKKLLDAAKLLGVSKSTLKRICRKHEISRWPFRNKKYNFCLLEPKPVTESVQVAVGAFCPTSSCTDAVGSNIQNSQCIKHPKQQRKEKILPSCKKSSIGGQTKITDQMIERNVLTHEEQLQESVAIKARYGKFLVTVPHSSTSSIVELKKALVKRLGLEHDNFYVQYQDADLDWILIACDEVLHECLTSLRGNKYIKLLVVD